jgi:hypothetical protein
MGPVCPFGRGNQAIGTLDPDGDVVLGVVVPGVPAGGAAEVSGFHPDGHDPSKDSFLPVPSWTQNTRGMWLP